MNYYCATPQRLQNLLEYRDKIINYTYSKRPTNRMLTNDHLNYSGQNLLSLNACFVLLCNADGFQSLDTGEWNPRAFHRLFTERINSWQIDSKNISISTTSPDEMVDIVAHTILYYMEPIGSTLPDHYKEMAEKLNAIFQQVGSQSDSRNHAHIIIMTYLLKHRMIPSEHEGNIKVYLQ